MSILPLLPILYVCQKLKFFIAFLTVLDSDATLRKTFSQLDKNGDGNLDASEFSAMVVDNFLLRVRDLNV